MGKSKKKKEESSSSSSSSGSDSESSRSSGSSSSSESSDDERRKKKSSPKKAKKPQRKEEEVRAKKEGDSEKEARKKNHASDEDVANDKIKKEKSDKDKSSDKTTTDKPTDKQGKKQLAIEDQSSKPLVVQSKSGRRKNIRQARTAMESDEDNEVVANSLGEARLIQKARRRGMGVCWTAEGEQNDDNATMEEETLKSVIHGSATGGLVSANAMAFQTKTEEVDEKVAGARERFIEEQLARMRGDQAHSKTEEKPKVTKKSIEDELYAIPSALKQEKEEIEESGDRWLTGIAEVPLPMGVKLANIERTEKAKAEHFLQVNGSVAPVSGNMSVNFRKNREEWIQQKKDESSAYQAALARKDGTKKEEGKAATSSLPAPPSGFASDDKVLDRFVKRYKYK